VILELILTTDGADARDLEIESTNTEQVQGNIPWQN